MKRICLTCEFWFKMVKKFENEDMAEGFCKRYPPKFDTQSEKAMQKFLASELLSDSFMLWTTPVTRCADWCGEWRPVAEPFDRGKGGGGVSAPGKGV